MKVLLSFLLVIFVVSSCMQRDRGERYTHDKPPQRASDTVMATTDRAGTGYLIPEVTSKRTINGTAVRIIDGDTFVLLLDNDFDTGVRLDGIDCPERTQAFSQRATKELSNLIFSREVTVYYDKKDGFGRVLGEVYVNQINVNHEMVRRGMAWHYLKYSDDEVLASLELEARQKKVGLWSEPNPVPPWEYRGK